MVMIMNHWKKKTSITVIDNEKYRGRFAKNKFNSENGMMRMHACMHEWCWQWMNDSEWRQIQLNRLSASMPRCGFTIATVHYFHWFIHPFIHSFIQSFIHSCINSHHFCFFVFCFLHLSSIFFIDSNHYHHHHHHHHHV